MSGWRGDGVGGVGDVMGTTVHSVSSTRVSVQYRADVPLGLFNPLHLREVWNGCTSIQRVPVFDLPIKRVWSTAIEEEEQASVSDKCTDTETTAQQQTTQLDTQLNTQSFSTEALLATAS